MGSLFRSEKMVLTQLYLQSDSAYHCLAELGELGLVQFRDLNPDVNSFHRKYVSEVRRCDEMQRSLRYLEKEIVSAKIRPHEYSENPDAPLPSEMIELESQFEKLEAEIREINSNQERLNRNFLELTELKHIFRQTSQFFSEAEQALVTGSDYRRREDEIGLLDAGHSSSSNKLSFVAGVINLERVPVFERLLWRACRGNVFLRYQEVDVELKDPTTGDPVYKAVFVIFFQGGQLQSRVKKICEGFRATIYPCPETVAERREMAMGVTTRIEDLGTVLSQTMDHRYRVLQAVAKNVQGWSTKVQKMKAIYHTLNLFNVDVAQQCLVGECWCPLADMDAIQYSLRVGHDRSGSSVMPILNVVQTKMNPPTYNKVNKFTAGFQNIIDAYGVGTYREVNPTPFSIITFPFLFAVMFGDLGHGLIMFLFALFLVLFEKKLAKFKEGGEIFGTFFHGRYIILLMGAFSMYTGFIYNDCFSKSFNIFGSSWHIGDAEKLKTGNGHDEMQLNITTDFTANNPYPFGVDPIWQVASNKLTFTNSYKMKMSVVLGVTQMMFGVVLSAFNYVFFGKRLQIFAVFIPEVIFLGSIFGYLVFMIFFKWILIDSSYLATIPGTGNPPEVPPDKGPGAPLLLIMLINMFLSFGNVPVVERFYSGQAEVQSFLVVMALLAVPWMLFTVPVVHMIKAKLRSRHGYVEFDKMEKQEQFIGDKAEEPPAEEHNMGDMFVHQSIHTIEFSLGCISNTASYLRLWALSLAHAELSEVLWNMMMRIGIKEAGGIGVIMVFGTFAVWAVLTIAILLIMEGLSAFLHALRLHWVEFNNKFYVGEGYKFRPFSFKALAEGDDQ